jgi:hypothetical protein
VETAPADQLHSEVVIQRLYRSGGEGKLLTTTIPKSWSFRMGLRPKTYIALELSPDATQITIRKVTLPFKDKVAAAEDVELEGVGAVENADVNSVPLSKSSGTK